MRALVVLLVVLGCASRSPVGALRFRNEPPVWRVGDERPLERIPDERVYNRTLYHTDGFVIRRATRALELREPTHARDVNALDEVPDSTWFVNRIGVRELSLDEVRRGANLGPSPFDHRPWKITGAKVGGMSLGFIFEDARGDRYILKFDQPRSPEMETGAHVIVHRILWAVGYHVPEDYLGYVTRDDLQIAPGAKLRRGDTKVALTHAELSRSLARAYRDGHGRYRVLASRFLPGKPIGPYAREGTRKDDPNDVIAHEHRRSLRGQRAIFSWLNHSDIQEDQTLDIFVKTGDGRGFVRHYILDFGKALGVMGYHLRWQTVGHTYRFDLGIALRTLATFGLWSRPWDGLADPGIRGIGLIDAARYDPGAWRPNSFYWPFEEATRQDAFWGARLVIRFTREQLAAIVDEARFTDSRARHYMLETLIARQRAMARYWFDRVAPLADLTVVSDGDRTVRSCFTDLLLAYRLRDVSTRYSIDTFDREGNAFGSHVRIGSVPSGRTCLDRVELSVSRDAYTIVRVRVFRNAHQLPPLFIHLARDEYGRVRIIGLRRS